MHKLSKPFPINRPMNQTAARKSKGELLMITRSVTLDSNDFFHARPAAKIADTARTYESVIMVMLGTEIADAKDPLSLMRLSHPKGSPVDILADGADEQNALNAVVGEIQKEFSLVS